MTENKFNVFAETYLEAISKVEEIPASALRYGDKVGITWREPGGKTKTITMVFMPSKPVCDTTPQTRAGDREPD
jgi:hypothetical protein